MNCDYGPRKTEPSPNGWQGGGWYRFTGEAGIMMATKTPVAGHCGTWGSGFLKEEHPTMIGKVF